MHDEAVAGKITKLIGGRVSLYQEEKVGLSTTDFGETRHFITGVTSGAKIPLGPGVVAPTMPAPSATAASAASR